MMTKEMMDMIEIPLMTKRSHAANLNVTASVGEVASREEIANCAGESVGEPNSKDEIGADNRNIA